MKKIFLALIVAAGLFLPVNSQAGDGGCNVVEAALRIQVGIVTQCFFVPESQTYQVNVLKSPLNAPATLGAVVGAVMGADLKFNDAQAKWIEIYAANSLAGRVNFYAFKACVVANGNMDANTLGICLIRSLQ